MIRKIKELSTKHGIKLLAVMPAFFGVCIFTYLIKFSGFYSVNERLSLLQGVVSFYSLVQIGFTYVEDRKAVKGVIMLLLLGVLFLSCSAFFYSIGNSIFLVSTISALVLVNTVTLHQLMVLGDMKKYLWFAIIRSIFQPLFLIYNNVFILIVLALAVLYCFKVCSESRNILVPFKAKKSGVQIIKSILIHTPFIGISFFDFKIQEIVGIEAYKEYVFYNKYVTGAINLLFSYKQLKVIFDSELKNQRLILYVLLSVLMGALFLSFANYGIVSLILIIGLYGLSVNLSSLVARSKLLIGLNLYEVLFAIIPFSILILCFYKASTYFELNIITVLALMTFSVVSTGILILTNLRKTANNA